MVEWAAANFDQNYEDEGGDGDGGGGGGSDNNSSYNNNNQQYNGQNNNQTQSQSQSQSYSNRSKRRRTSETPEAAIARLTSAYNAAMIAVGALHKASDFIAKKQKKRNSESNLARGNVDVVGDAVVDDVANSTTNDNTNDNEKGDLVTKEMNENDEKNSNMNDTTDMEIDKDINMDINMEIDSEMKNNVNDDYDHDDKNNNNSKNNNKNNNNEEEEEFQSLKRVAIAARLAFENAVLSDPLIIPYAPTVSETIQQIKMNNQNNKNNNNNTGNDNGNDDNGNSINNITRNETTKKYLNTTAAAAAAASSSMNSIPKAHQVTVKKLAYLSLVNYADLIISCCSCGLQIKSASTSTSTFQRDEVLDRGAVRTLDAILGYHNYIKTSKKCTNANTNTNTNTNATMCATQQYIWNDIEEEEHSKRLALVSYCDAADLDGSDPTTWLKVACGARALGRVFQDRQLVTMMMTTTMTNKKVFLSSSLSSPSSSLSDVKDDDEYDETTSNDILLRNTAAFKDNLSYNRLERYALERGLTTLRPGIPCNRTISRAFRELEQNILNSPESYCLYPKTTCDENGSGGGSGKKDDDLVIDLPRYNWSTLGRSLLKACKLGATPAIHLKISPMLTLPTIALGLVCEFLGLYNADENGDVSADVKNLESTCRALSVDIISARALIEKERSLKMKQIEQEMHQILENENNDIRNNDNNDANGKKVDSEIELPMNDDEIRDEQQKQNRTNRTSKRVRSQLITSGKQAERSAKRKNVEYCLICSILPCTTDHPIYSTFSGEFSWETLKVLTPSLKIIDKFLRRNIDDKGVPDCGDNNVLSVRNLKTGINAQLGKASLKEFICQWNGSNTGALNMLHRFLAHTSCHIDEVCLNEQGGAMILTSCISECFDILMGLNTDSYSKLSPPWLGELTFSQTSSSNNLMVAIETLAINLLCAELQMRACERQVFACQTFSDKGHKLKLMLPYLLQYASLLGECEVPHPFKKLLLKLQIRTQWLAGTFYVWWSKNTQKLCDEKESEKLALDHVDKAIQLLKCPLSDPITEVKTPQLISPGRSGIHWVELSVTTLTLFRDDLEASTVLSHYRQNFYDLLATWKKLKYNSTADFSEEDKEKLQSIGCGLLQRYQLGNNEMSTGVKTDELIEDFITLYISYLPPSISIEDDAKIVPNRWPSLWNKIPTSQVPILFDDLSNSSFMTIMSLTLLFKSNSRVILASFLGNLFIAVLDKYTVALTQMEVSRAINNVRSINNEDSSEDDSSEEHDKQGLDLNPKNIDALIEMVYFLTSKLWDLLNETTEEELKEIMKLVDVTVLIQFSIEVSSGYCPQSRKDIVKNTIHVPQNLDLLKTSLVFASMLKTKLMDEFSRRKFSSSIFTTLCKTLVRERNLISYLVSKGDNDVGRSESHKLLQIRSLYISVVASEIGALLSCQRIIDSHELMRESFLIQDFLMVENQNENEPIYTLFPLVKLAESLAWFWTFLSSTNTKATECLRVSIAAAITTLIGSSGYANSGTIMMAFSRLKDQSSVELAGLFSLSDYFESDDSAKGCVDEDTIDTHGIKLSDSRRLILHALCRSVQCIGLLFSSCNETEASSIKHCFYSHIDDGYFLPLITARVLGSISDFVLNEYCEQNKSLSSLWAEEYPFGFRCSGAQLDALLYKAYRCLHGINLSSQSSHIMTSKDYAIPAPCSSSAKRTHFPPESIKASAQLYRCIMRAYAGGRRTIPTDSLECVLLALPQIEEDASLAAIKKYLYQRPKSEPLHPVEGISDILEYERIDEMPKDFPGWILDENKNLSDRDPNDEEAYIVRKGVCQYFTEGPLPCMGSSSCSSKPEESKIAEEREIASRVERAVRKKFRYVIESLQYDPRDASKWYRAGLCIGVKIDIILDRLVQAQPGYNDSDFYLKKYSSENDRQSDFQKSETESLSLASLVEKQHSIYKGLATKKYLVLGDDYSMYLENQWSDFSCLRNLSSRLRSDLMQKVGDVKVDDGEFSHWSMIQSKFDEGNFAEWQLMMGRIFVIALQVIRDKCFRAAFILSKKENDNTKENIHPEISESLGTMYYSDIGFNLKKLSAFEIRRKSKLAQLFFERALNSILETEEDDLAEYDLQFMIGKCQEKIAKTLQHEVYCLDSTRLYKVVMSKALKSYNKALMAAQKYEKEHGKMLDSQGGGSAHGIVELIYRLHASRFKILLCAIRKSKDERDLAETEALEMTEAYWFEQPKDSSIEGKVQNTRERIWSVLADIVESMVYCRREQAFFHRSIYRHAQALLWAPLFHDPNGSIHDGSFAVIPANKSYRLRGLSSGSCAKCAGARLYSLFDKKRPQLCAVWVTTPLSPSPFEYINDSSRKFDRIRWKYIGAFVDCTRLCRSRTTLENFIKWCDFSSRDLPSFYDVTATEEGETPQNSHSNTNLLSVSSGLIYFAMKYTNGAIAEIISHEVDELMRQDIDDDAWKKYMTELLRDAYKCFLRLNCPINNSLWKSTKIKHQMCIGNIAEVETFCKIFMALNAIESSPPILITWEQKMLLLTSAIKEAQKLFPFLALNSFALSKRKRKRMKPNNFDIDNKEEPTSQKIIVKVPSGVQEGDKFVVMVVCGYFKRKLQLVATTTKRIMFHLKIPKDAGFEITVVHCE